MQDQDFDAIIAGAKTPTRSIPLCMRADVLAEIGELERRIHLITGDDDDPRMASAHEDTAAELADQIRALETVAADNTINLRVQALDRKLWKRKVDEHKHTDEETGVEKLDIAALIENVLLDQSCEAIVSPKLSVKQVTNLLDVLSDGQWEAVINGVFELNRTTTTVGKSVTASLVFMKRSGKPAPDGQ